MFPLKAITNHVFVVTLRGENVFHECSLFCFIRDIQEEVLEKISIEIEKEHNLKVYDFSKKFDIFYAETSDPKVKVFIEEVYAL